MITKTQVEILKLFASRITKGLSISEVSTLTKKSYALIHRNIKELVNMEFLLYSGKTLFLNYKKNLGALIYAESIRKEEFLRINKTIQLFEKDILQGIKEDFFILLVFGSVLYKKEKARDIDILMITDKSKVDLTEKFMTNIASNFNEKFDINVIPTEGAYEMLAKREQVNIVNEALNNHIILFGGENFYNILKNAR